MEQIDDLYAMLAAHSCMLRALAHTHPDSTKLLQQLLGTVRHMTETYRKSHPPEFVAAFERHASICEGMIPV